MASAEELRDLSTDRPDATESPYTVDKGHYQMELEIASITRDGGQTTGYGLGELNAKYGMTDAADIQFVLPMFNHEHGGDEGFGDMQVRLKYNFWGNDEDGDALAIMPYIKLPTGNDDLSNDHLEGGLILPYGFEGAGGWSWGLMAEVDIEADEDGDGYHTKGLFSVAAGHDLTESTGFFLEAVQIVSPEDSNAHEAYFNTGLTWSPESQLQFDGGVRVGLTDDSTDLVPFIGVSSKF